MATRYWEGGGTDPTDLADATNWSANTLPVNGDTAIIADGSTTEQGYFHGSLPASGTLAAFRIGSQIKRNFGVSGGVAATASMKVISTVTNADIDTDTFTLEDSDGTSQVFTFDNSSTATGATVGISGLAIAAIADKIVDSINSIGLLDIAATPDPPTVDSSGDYAITLTQSTTGTAGNTSLSTTGSDVTDITFDSDFAGGINAKCTINATIMELSGKGSYQSFDGTQTTVSVNDGIESSDMVHLSGTITTLKVLGSNGTVNIADSSTATTIELTEARFANVIVGDSVTNTSITVSAGKVTTSSNSTTIDVIGGTAIVNGSATCGTLTMHSRSLVKYNTSGTLTTLTVNGGTMDMSNSTASSVTVTNCTLHEGGVIDERSGLGNAVWTNGISCRGGIVLTDISRTLVIT